MGFNEEMYGKLYQIKNGDTASQKTPNFTFALFLGYDFIMSLIVRFIYEDDVTPS